jgi:4-amino-4-deoxy-L-arabinose transferase-like glycosyltransferase
MNILKKKEFYFYLALVFVTLYAFLVRFLGIKFGLPYLHEWDEPRIVGRALQMLKTGDFNPRFFNYPGFLLYISVIINTLHFLSLVTSGDLKDLNDIIVGDDIGWCWTVSHPSFYLWNRIFVCFLGTSCVVITYFILKKSFGEKEGILGAILLAGFSWWHIYYSRCILTDIPVSFWTLLVVLSSLQFNYSHKIRPLIFASIFVGLAISSKYNVGIVILVPLTAYLLNIKHVKFDKSLTLGIILILPLIIFLIINPFVVFNFNTFLNHIGREIHWYKIVGHPTCSSTPGIENFMVQVTHAKNTISSFLVYMALFGVLVGLRKRNPLFIILIFPVIYTYFMTQQKINFHRNFVCIYPFLAIFSAIAIIFIAQKFHQLGLFLQKKYFHKVKYLNILLSLIPLVVVIMSVFRIYIKNFKEALHIWRTKETRTQAIEYINSMVRGKNNITVGIARELRIHNVDLKKLNTDYEIFEHKDVKQALRTHDYLIVGEYDCYDKALYGKEVERLNKLTPKNLICHTIYTPHGRTLLDLFSINPKIIFLKGLKKDIIKISLSQLEGKKKLLEDGSLWLPWNSKLKSKKIQLEKAKYKISIIAKGTEANGENARLKIYIGDQLIDDYFTEKEYKERVILFMSKKEEETNLIVEFVNDYCDREKGLDRNAWIKSITITKI